MSTSKIGRGDVRARVKCGVTSVKAVGRTCEARTSSDQSSKPQVQLSLLGNMDCGSVTLDFSGGVMAALEAGRPSSSKLRIRLLGFGALALRIGGVWKGATKGPPPATGPTTPPCAMVNHPTRVLRGPTDCRGETVGGIDERQFIRRSVILGGSAQICTKMITPQTSCRI